MAKIVFINAFETSYLGTRILASYMRVKGHETHNILLGTGEYISIEEPLEKHEGYQSYSRGVLCVNKATRFKLSQIDYENLEKIIKHHKPDVIGFSARSTNNWLAPILQPIFKRSAPEALLIAGGFGPTLEPELYLSEGFDCVIRCDGEESLACLLELVDKKKNDASVLEEMLTIKNTVWKKDDALITNPLFPQDKNLSKYGAPIHGNEYFSFINNDQCFENFDPEINNGLYYTYFGRGCIGHCTYCSGGQWASLYQKDNAKFYKRRNREIPELISELEKMPEVAHHIWFVDEFFALSKEKTLEFCKLYKERIGRTFFTYINYDFMLENKNIFDALVDAGLTGTGIGFQTGSEKFAREIYHRKLRNSHLLEFAKLCFDTNLYTGIHIIGGNCYEDDETFYETIDLVQKLPYSIETPNINPIENIRLRPHPKSPITYLSPRVVSDPMSAHDWFYRGILLELSRITDRDEINDIYKNKKYYDNLKEFNQLFLNRRAKKQINHYKDMINQIAGRRIVYFGMGSLFEENRDFFKDLQPDAIIVDKKYKATDVFDGVRVYESDDFLANQKGDDETIYLTFVANVVLPRKKLNFRYGIPNDRIHSVATILKHNA